MAADMNLTPPSFTVLEHVYDPILGYAKMDNDMAGYGLWPTNSRLTEKTLKVMVMGGSTTRGHQQLGASCCARRLNREGETVLFLMGQWRVTSLVRAAKSY